MRSKLQENHLLKLNRNLRVSALAGEVQTESGHQTLLAMLCIQVNR